MKEIILASSSPRRKELLTQLIGNNFKIIESSFEEDNEKNITPIELAKEHALGKAKEVAEKLESGIVIGSDTFLSFKNKVLGKPHTKENAIQMLEKLSENEVEVYSGIALVDAQTKQEIVEYVITKIKIKKLTNKEINEYVENEKPLDKAGAFAIQERGAILIEKIDGDYFNIVGLPLFKLNQMFKKIGINIYEY